MEKSQIQSMPDFFGKYITLVEEDNLMIAFQNSLIELESINLSLYNGLGDKTYQEGKWTIKDIFQHLVDNERIQSYRALRFARGDTTELPGYDEVLFGKNSTANRRQFEDILDELKLIRLSTIKLYESFNASAVNHTGICFHQSLSVLALGFVIVGHQIHHQRVISEKYMPLLNN